MAAFQQNLSEATAVIDMSTLEDGAGLDDNISIASSGEEFVDVRKRETATSDTLDEVDPALAKGLTGALGQSMAEQVWKTGSQQAKKAFNLYANIDILRPYFDVEPRKVMKRLLSTFVPSRIISIPQKVASELYGPLMIVFTLIAVLLYNMKSSGHTVREGTLMGTAFFVCFGYWWGTSALLYFIAYICNSHIAAIQVLSLTGYALVAHCVVLFLGTAFHSVSSHSMFYLMWAIFGGLSTLKMVLVYMSRTSGQTQRLVLTGTCAVLHLLFLLYLHFAYHNIVEDLDQTLQLHVPRAPVSLSHDIPIRSTHPVIRRVIDPQAVNPIARVQELGKSKVPKARVERDTKQQLFDLGLKDGLDKSVHDEPGAENVNMAAVKQSPHQDGEENRNLVQYGGQAAGKPGDLAIGMPGDQAIGMPGDQAIGKTEDQTTGKPGDQANRKLGDQAIGNPGDQAIGMPGDQAIQRLEDQAMGKPGDQVGK
ncbi:Hypp2917 [Branchiostoma lanceolatum]|uniref:Protein YIPF3 n=1 Tax=Branchiostoma lanceolatum TaxID=7740 RepID=A0A8J9ZXT8_BRALA|nr:Hypp2917 [Branchiostoma lanceolatum]